MLAVCCSKGGLGSESRVRVAEALKKEFHDEVLALQCDLWRRERTLRKELQTVCVTVDSRMRSIDDALESLRNDLQVVDNALRMRSLQLQ
eukprot:s6374_g7.t1